MAKVWCRADRVVFEEEEDPANKSFFSEIISSISDVKFSHDGRYILSRDYLTLKVWDVNMESRPLASIPIHDYLRPKLCDLYENDCIFDKFEGNWGPTGSNVLTGGYSNYFHVIDWERDSSIVLQADKSAFKAKKLAASSGKAGRGMAGANNGPGAINPNSVVRDRRPAQPSADHTQDFNKKILHASYHPREDTIAVRARRSTYFPADPCRLPRPTTCSSSLRTTRRACQHNHMLLYHENMPR